MPGPCSGKNPWTRQVVSLSSIRNKRQFLLSLGRQTASSKILFAVTYHLTSNSLIDLIVHSMALSKASDLENNKSNMSMIHLRVCQVGKYMYIIVKQWRHKSHTQDF